MTNRVSTLKAHVLLAGGSTRVSALKLGVYADDKTNGIRVSSFRALAWTSLDQGLHMGPVFGGGEVFTPEFTSETVLDIPPAPEVEVNPYQANAPSVDHQRIMREQHNLIQAGDTTFHWGVLTEIYAEPEYNLGSLGRFYHDDLGIIQARFCKFLDFVRAAGAAFPVGWHSASMERWTVTNQLSKSSADYTVGVAVPYNAAVYDGPCYGWVIVDGLVPAEMDVLLDSTSISFGTEYGWHATGQVKPAINTPAVGSRFTVSNVPTLPVGAFYVQLKELSLARLQGQIATQLAPLTSQLDTTVSDVAALTVTTNQLTAQVGKLQADHDALATKLASEIKSLSNALQAIRNLMPSGNYQTYVDAKVDALRAYVDAADSLIGGVANQALLRANEAFAKAEAQSPDALQNQIDALNNAMGGITNRLVGFTVDIDTAALTAGQILHAVLDHTDADGVNFYVWEPTTLAAGGDVVGPAGATDTNIARFDGATGKLIQNSVVTVGDGGSVQTVIGPTGDAVLGFNGFQIQTEAASSGFRVRAHGNASNNAGVNAFFRLRGTILAPTLVMAGDILGSCIFRGWNGSSIVNGCYASFGGVATQNANLGGSAIYFSTVPNGGGNANLTERMRIDQDGFVKAHVGVQVPAEVYGVGWSGDLSVPTKADLYTKIESMSGGGGGSPIGIDLGSYSQGFSNSTGAQASKANILKTLQATTIHGVFPRFISKVVGGTYQCTIATLTTASGFTIDTVLGTSDVYTATTVDQEWAEITFSTPVTIPANTRFALIISRTGVAGTTVLTLSAASTGEVVYSKAGFMDTAVTNLGYASYTAANPPVSGTAAATSGGTNCYAIGVRFSH